MIHGFIIVLLSVLSFNAQSNEICTFTAQEKEFFEFTESYPFKDKRYSQQSVSDAKERLKAHKSGKKVNYYIHDNTLNIIKGGELQSQMFEAKKELEEYIPIDQSKWDRKKYKLKYKYLKSRKEYCDFQRTHYAIDW